MDNIEKTTENNAKVKALKIISNAIGKIYWVGSLTYNSLDECLRVLNLNSWNSGWYNPTAIKISGLTGYYMINEDKSIYWESRIIKQQENKYLIEHLSNEGCNEFEKLYIQLTNL